MTLHSPKMKLARTLAVSITLMLTVSVVAFAQEATKTVNALKDLSVSQNSGTSRVTILAENDFGESYSVYTAQSPSRIVVDLPRMDIADVPRTIQSAAAGISGVGVDSFDVSLGTLARIEIAVDQPTPDYEVTVNGSQLIVALQAPTSELTKQTPMPTGQQSVMLEVGGTIDRFSYFDLGNPPRLVVDVYGSGLEPSIKGQPLSGGFNRYRTGAHDNKVRFVFDTNQSTLPSYAVSQQGDAVQVQWGSGAQSSGGQLDSTAAAISTASSTKIDGPTSVEAVDFSVVGNESVFAISLTSPLQPPKPTVKGNTIVLALPKASMKPSLRRYIDTSAFPSSVKRITPYVVGSESRFAIEMREVLDYKVRTQGSKVIFSVPNGQWAYRKNTDQQKTLPVLSSNSSGQGSQPVPAEQRTAAVGSSDGNGRGLGTADILGQENKTYTGEKITLIFDSADIRNVLQLIAEVSNLNIIANEDVKGQVTLRLKDVPWDQALDVLLETSDLGMLQQGNVVRVLPRAKIRAMREAALSSVNAQEKLQPLTTQVFEVSYTDLGNISDAIKDVVSDRGKITEDARNKQVIVSDVPSRLDDVADLIKILDTPERQVLIEARIVEVNANFSRNLGVNWGLNYQRPADDPNTRGRTNQLDIGAGGNFSIFSPSVATTGLGTSIAFGVLKNTNLDLKLSAVETSGEGRVISRPKVTTLNGEEATIKQGTTIPYQSSGDDGLPKTEFVEANLELKVTPVINPDNSVILEIETSNNTPSTTDGAEAPSIDTKEAETKVLVRDGQTTVIGGIFVENENDSASGVPVLKDVPLLGNLFKSTTKVRGRSELLIFITPRILE